MISEKDGMTLMYVPAGEFTMGSNDGDADEKPAHTIYLDAFWIDRTEVTNKMNSVCVKAGICEEPTSKRSYDHSSYYGNAEYDNNPVIWMDWSSAQTYCAWVGRRLPSEAEWEKAARGTDARIYPWGNDPPNGTLISYNYDTSIVGKYPLGASPYGALDMASNVWEWVADWYSETYYSSSPTSNPFGANSGQYRILRGGAWDNPLRISATYRYEGDPANHSSNVGFRCAMSATP